MQGVHAFDPTVKTTIDLESFVAEDHLFRHPLHYSQPHRNQRRGDEKCAEGETHPRLRKHLGSADHRSQSKCIPKCA